MDALALLCNLYANGPATLECLRRSGCDHLSTLETLPLDELERCLGATPARTQRFLAEARLLRDRLGVSLLEPQEQHDPGGLAEQAAPPVRDEEPQLESPAPVERQPRGTQRLDSFPGERPVIDAVLDAWRLRDAVQPPARPGEEAGGEGAAGNSSELLDASRVGNRDMLVPLSPVGPAGTPLSGAQLGGLDTSAQKALRGAGVSTVEELLAARALEISRASGLSFTRVTRWQFLARRAGLGRGVSGDAGSGLAALRTAGGASDGPSGEGAAGPFA